MPLLGHTRRAQPASAMVARFAQSGIGRVNRGLGVRVPSPALIASAAERASGPRSWKVAASSASRCRRWSEWNRRHVSAIGARLPQRLDGRLGFALVRCDETPSVVLTVATTGAARLWSTVCATLVFRSPSLRAAVVLVRRVPRRCMGAREGPPPGPPSRAVRSRGDQRPVVDGRVA